MIVEVPTPYRNDDFLIVGVGASAGGVEALSTLFENMPREIRATFVVVTHLSSSHESQLSEVLARHTWMPVAWAPHGEELRENHIYVLPADSILTVSNLRLELRSIGSTVRERNPVDILFASLAHDAGENSVGIILSGAGSDGALGVKAIKEQGGLTIAQGHDHSAPRHSGMPASAIATGLVDIVASVQDIGAKLLDYGRAFQRLNAMADETKERTHEELFATSMREIYETLHKRVGHDFEGYKEKTLVRRVQRRMQVQQVFDLPAYVERLRHDPLEAGLLFRDLLIGVTSFFRDREAFDVLASKVIPRLFEGIRAGDALRVWVPGCATGEEAYSIAMLLREHMDNLPTEPKVQVFATDIDESSLTAARAGRYPSPLLENVSPDRLKRFFREEPESYVLTKEVRDLCIFSSHSVIRDPPFSRMDMISCRNLLIYFGSKLQESVLPVFHYALKPSGYLFLGPSESISRFGELFGVIDKKQRIFQRRPTLPGNVRLPSWLLKGRGLPRAESGTEAMRRDQRYRTLVEARIMEGFTPAHIVVEADGSIVYYSMRTGKYLEPQMGAPSRQILSMARKGLRLELRSLLREAVEKRQRVVRDRVEVELDDRVQLIQLTIEPIAEGEEDPLYLIVFTDLGPPLSHEQVAAHRPQVSSGNVASLERELRETRERLQASVEEYETALEELKSGNEELVSVNEELQSTNEELETSKEELQSVNEELHTVNNELATKVEELHQSNADLSNLFESTQIATVFLDRFMIIRSYTPAVTAIFNLIASDRGRPITDIAHQLENVDLRADIQTVLDRRRPLERAVHLRGGKIFHLMRILPYRTVDEEIDGVLVTFVDVTAMVAAEEQQRLLIAELNHRVRNMLQVVIGLANQTLHRSSGLEEFGNTFIGRIQALARAYELLSRESWRRVPICDLVEAQLASFATEGRRYSRAGPPLVLTPNAALALGLVLYELATNATKYGAFSSPEGRVEISWDVVDGSDGPRFVFQWVEKGGPPVKAPARVGFGSELIKRQLTYEFNGDAEIDFAEDGVRVRLTIPTKESIVIAAREGRGDADGQ